MCEVHSLLVVKASWSTLATFTETSQTFYAERGLDGQDFFLQHWSFNLALPHLHR